MIGKGRTVTCKCDDGTQFQGTCRCHVRVRTRAHAAHLSITETRVDDQHYFTGTLQKLDVTVEQAPKALTITERFSALDMLLDAAVVITEKGRKRRLSGAVSHARAPGLIVFFSKVAEQLFGHTKESIAGQNVRMLMPGVWSSVPRASVTAR